MKRDMEFSGSARVAHNDLGSADLECSCLHRIAHENSQLMTVIDQLVRDPTAEKTGGAQQQNPRHGAES